MNNSFIDRLLERTADWHTRFGQNMLLLNLLGPKATLTDYRKYLAALYGFVSAFERYIYPELKQFIPDLSKRMRTSIIQHDLLKLGERVNGKETMPESYFRSMYADPYAALGALYVLESSTLGGELIQKHLQATIKQPVVAKLNYFAEENKNLAWSNFLEQFCSVAENSDKEENIIDGALRTLRLLDQLMTEESVKV